MTTWGRGMVRTLAAVLGGPELRRPAGEGDELAVDPNLAAQEVHTVGRQAEHLALSHAGSGGEDDEGSVPLWDGVGDGDDGLGR